MLRRLESIMIIDDFLKGKCPSFAWIFLNKNFVKGKSLKNVWFPKKIRSLLKENLLKMSEFLYWSMKTDEDFDFKPKKFEFLPCLTKSNLVRLLYEVTLWTLIFCKKWLVFWKTNNLLILPLLPFSTVVVSINIRYLVTIHYDLKPKRFNLIFFLAC
jgi:hypothetical protein